MGCYNSAEGNYNSEKEGCYNSEGADYYSFGQELNYTKNID